MSTRQTVTLSLDSSEVDIQFDARLRDDSLLQEELNLLLSCLEDLLLIFPSIPHDESLVGLLIEAAEEYGAGPDCLRSKETTVGMTEENNCHE